MLTILHGSEPSAHFHKIFLAIVGVHIFFCFAVKSMGRNTSNSKTVVGIAVTASLWIQDIGYG
jgi:hypothetical protein